MKKKAVAYAMADPELEGLRAARKHLIRMGPKNTSKIQAKLREILAQAAARIVRTPRPIPRLRRDAV